MRRKVVIGWGVSSFYGWGVYGLNLALAWSRDQDVQPVCAYPIRPEALAVDPLSLRVLQPFLRDSAELVVSFEPHAGGVAESSGPVLLGLNESFTPVKAAHDMTLVGRPSIGVTFLETTQLRPEAAARARDLPLIVAGSRWNEAVLRTHGVERVTTVLQGIDPALFHPAPRRGLLADRFLVFSGGKLERRKGQDLVLAAFRVFAERHPDALLVTAWHSPWPDVARTLDASGLVAPIPFRPDGRPDVEAWAQASGLPAGRVIDLGMIPNPSLPPLFREMDVALFPNRCEGGTNLVAMECMACGVPTILSANTGHLDLIEDDNSFPLRRQAPLEGAEAGHGEAPGWGESDVDEILEALETAYVDREAARRRGLKGAETLGRLTWARTAEAMKAAILPLA